MKTHLYSQKQDKYISAMSNPALSLSTEQRDTRLTMQATLQMSAGVP